MAMGEEMREARIQVRRMIRRVERLLSFGFNGYKTTLYLWMEVDGVGRNGRK